MERAHLIDWLRTTGCAVERKGWVFLFDPAWTDAERAVAHALLDAAAPLPAEEDGWLCIRTGGSSGGMKFARHDEQTLGAAVRGFCQHFGLARVHTVGVLPPWHVSGLMARVRSVATGGEYVNAEWKALEAGRLPELASNRDWVLSLVPTQLQRLLRAEAATVWLRRFAIIFIGGGPIWPELAEEAARAKLRLSLSYGMTETAAMVTAQRPEEFLSGDRSAGVVLPHAQVDISAEGRVCVGGESLFRGFFPNRREGESFLTADTGRLDEQGRLHLLGRADAVIITGGKKVQPLDVEATLRRSGEFEDVALVSLPDLEWGEIVVACYPAGTGTPDLDRAAAELAPHERPKHLVAIEAWPRSAAGKINRAELAERARRALGR